jgi:ribosome-binding factor A
VSRRHEQLVAALERAVRTALSRGLADPRIKGLITVVGVDLAADLKTAIVRVSVLPEEAEATTLHGLEAAAAHVRHAIADDLPLQHTPHLRFRVDRSLKEQAAVLATINRDLQRLRPVADGADEPPAPNAGAARSGEDHA